MDLGCEGVKASGDPFDFLKALPELLLRMRHKTGWSLPHRPLGGNCECSVLWTVTATRHALEEEKLNRQDHTDGRTVAWPRSDLEFPAVGFQHAADGGQTEAGTSWFGGAQNRREGATTHLLGQAVAGVLELE